MLISILIAIALGIVAGTITGLIPGIHINLVAVLLLAASPVLLTYTTPLVLAIFVISMAITHTFEDTIPSIFLGAPEAETALSVLPGHKMLLEGKGYEAVKLTVVGSLFGLVAAAILIFGLVPTIKSFYDFIKNYIPHILIFASGYLILKDQKSKIWALISFLIAGVLGLGVLNIATLKEPLFPLFSGLFGISTLALSLKDKTKIPKQKITSEKIEKRQISKAVGSGLFASTICGLLPGIGAAQAAIIASSLSKKWNTKTFLILIGSINTIVMVISFVALYVLGKTRNGAILAVSKILEGYGFNHLILFIAVALVVGGIVAILTLNLAKVFAKIMTKVNYQKLCIGIILLITTLVTIISGPLGLFVLIISSFLGMLPALKGIGRNHLMGCLILPVILYFIL